MIKKNNKCVGTGEASKILGVSPSTVRRLCDNGTLKSKRSPGNKRIISMPEKKSRIYGGNVIDKIYFEINKSEKSRVQKLCSDFQEIINRKYKNEMNGIETNFEEDFKFFKNILDNSQLKKIKNRETLNDEIQKFIFKEAPVCKKYLEIYGDGKLKSPVVESPKTPNGLKNLKFSFSIKDIDTVLL